MTTSTDNNRSRIFLLLFLSVFVDLIGFGIIAPLLPFIAEKFGANPLGVTLLFALYSLMQLIFTPFWGYLSDRVGRRPILLLSYVGSAVAYLFFAIAPTLWLVFAARGLAGMMGSSISVTKAYIADITPPQDRAKGMGVIGAAFGCGFMIGPALGGMLAGSAENPNFQLPLFVAAGLSLGAFTFAFTALPESLPKITGRYITNPPRADLESSEDEQIGREKTGRENTKGKRHTSNSTGDRHFNLATIIQILRPAQIRQLISILVLFSMATVGVQSILVLWCERQFEWGPRPLGFLFMFYGIIAATIQGGLTGRLTQRFRENKLLTAGAALQGFSLVLIPLSTTVPLLVASTSMWVVGEAVYRPAMSSLLSKSASPEQQGLTLGMAQSFTSLSNILGPIIAGTIFTVYSGEWAFWWSASFMVLAVLLSLQFKGQQRQESDLNNSVEERDRPLKTSL